jgi:flagellar biosynthetic protein FliR
LNFESLVGVSLIQILLGFTRTSGLVVTAPIFQSRSVPIPVKVVISFALALVIAPFIRVQADFIRYPLGVVILILLQEVLVGLIIGFIANFAFYAVQLGGYFFDVSLGFGVVNIIDPNSGTEMPLLGQLNYLIAMVVFLAINAHHSVILALIKSYEIVGPGMLTLKKETTGVVLSAFSGMFLLGFRIGLPIIGAIFLTDVALGIISKLLPQINVFMIGFPVKILLGLMMLMLFLPVYIMVLETVFANSGDTFRAIRTILLQLHG